MSTKKNVKSVKKASKPRKKEVTEFTINRGKWCRGESNTSLQRKKDNSMCCLGFFSKACGIPTKEIVERSLPSEVSDTFHEFFPSWVLSKLFYCQDNATDIYRLVKINDDADLRAKDRERQIAKIFRNHGIKVHFTGKTSTSQLKAQR